MRFFVKWSTEEQETAPSSSLPEEQSKSLSAGSDAPHNAAVGIGAGSVQVADRALQCRIPVIVAKEAVRHMLGTSV